MIFNLHLLKSPTSQLVLVGLFAAAAVGVVGWKFSQHQKVDLPPAKSTGLVSLPKVIQRLGVKYEPPVPTTPVIPKVHEPLIPTRPPALPLTVISAPPPPPEVSVALTAPYGRMIPCETVITIESNRLDTPVIGLVTEDIWEQGNLVIPAGAEVHGHAALDRNRDRLAAIGSWKIIWRQAAPRQTEELRIEGIALDRRRDSEAWRDGSVGLRGEILRVDDLREAKLFAATFLATATAALQDTRTTAGLLGETTIPAATARNATLAGSGAILREYAQQLHETITRDGFYVRVPAGTPFYLYVTQPIAVNPVGRLPTVARSLLP